MRMSLRLIAPVRAVAVLFSETVKVSAASPWPLAGATRIHDASLAAVHEHSRAAPTVSDSSAPLDETGDSGVTTVAWQRTTLGPVISVTAVLPQPARNNVTALAPRSRKFSN